ncbi:MAG: hypothetical protein ACREUA_05315 [Burkholderiales bacterium]
MTAPIASVSESRQFHDQLLRRQPGEPPAALTGQQSTVVQISAQALAKLQDPTGGVEADAPLVYRPR